MKPSEFIAKYLPLAQGVQDKYGVPVSVTLSQAAIESSWGENWKSNQFFNYFGIKADKSWTGPVFSSGTKEEVNGTKVPTVGLFRKYGSIAESFDDYGLFLTTNQRYGPAFKQTNSYDFGYQVAKAGYATDSNYYNMMQSIMKSNNLTQYDKGGPIPAPSGGGSSGGIIPVISNKDKQFMEELKKKYESGQMTPEERKEYESKMEDMLGGVFDKDTWSNGIDNMTNFGSDLMQNIIRIVIILLVVVVIAVAVFMTIKASGNGNGGAQ